jgi:hypothetical protein
MRMNEWQDIDGLRETSGGAIQQPSLQIRLGRISDRVNQNIQLPPLPLDTFENRLQIAFFGDIQRQEQCRLKLVGQRFDKGFGLFMR